jgi:hypothetical protein
MKEKRKYVKTKIGINPHVFLFRQKSNPKHSRKVFGTGIDDTPKAWAVHAKVAVPGRNYLRHITEWFEKSLWSKHEPLVKRREGFLAGTPFAPSAKAIETPIEETPKPTMESPKNSPPPITFVDDDDDTEEIPVAAVAPPKLVSKLGPKGLNEEYPGEYNPRAHKEQIAGKEEDLIVFDDIVNSNYIAQQRRNKLMQLRAKQEGRGVRPSPANPIVAGFEPG